MVVDIYGFPDLESNRKQSDIIQNAKFNTLYTENCKLCEEKVDYGFKGAALTYRPAILSLVTIAVVCVCTALLFKSMPRVCFGPLRWDSLKYGAM